MDYNENMKKALATLVAVAILAVLGIVAWNFIYQAPASQTNGTSNIPEPQSQIEDIIVGRGTEVLEGYAVTINFRTIRQDGTEIASYSGQGDDPLGFTVGYDLAVPGELEYGVVGMKVGGKRKITVPPELVGSMEGFAYMIPEGESLIFEIEILTAQKANVDEIY